MKRQMTKKTTWVTILLLLLPGTLCAQDITGVWQGALKAGEMRVLIRILKQLDGSLEAKLIKPD